MKIEYPIRINRYLALKNYATRKEADELIKKGLVFVNNKKAILGEQIEETDKVLVRFRGPKKEHFYYAYNKPVNISTNPDLNTKNILQVTKFLSSGKKIKVFPVGRLDKDSHGLILMTNDGRITDRLLSPKYIHEKEYLVKVKPNFSDRFLELMSQGVSFDNLKTKKCKIWRASFTKDKTGQSKDTFHIILTEGKKRQIRRMCQALHHTVIDLRRIRIMNIELKKTKPGEYREIKEKELTEFLKLLKLI